MAAIFIVLMGDHGGRVRRRSHRLSHAHTETRAGEVFSLENLGDEERQVESILSDSVQGEHQEQGVLPAVWGKYGCRTIVLQQSGATLVDFVLNSFSFQGENPRPSVVVPGNDGFLVVFLLKTLSGDWTFFSVKTQDLHCYLSGGVILKNLFRSLGVFTTGGAVRL
jgi:hypothetical protein